MHGIKVIELTSGTRAIKAVATSIIGLIFTAPDAQAEVKSSLLTGVVASNNAHTITAKLVGNAGNAISLELVDPDANSQALAINVTGNAITARLATSAGGAITTTAAQLKTAIEAHAGANALIGLANTGASTGAGVLAALTRTRLAGGIDEAFPLGERTLITDVRRALALVGDTGTGKAALTAIADQCSPIIVGVRVDEDDEDQDDLVIAGLARLLGAQGEYGFRPRILGAPGLDTLDVAAEIALTARKLRARSYARAIGANITERRAYRQNFGARELMLLAPGWSEGPVHTVASALGLRSRIDSEQGWHKSISNVAVDGVTGIAEDVSFDITGEDHDAALYNAADITTMIRQNGFRFWGNRTCSDEPLFAFETTVAAAQVLQDEIAEGLMWAIDKPLTKVLIKDILETINAAFRRMVAAGQLIGATAWYDPALNPEADLAAGKLVIDYDFTPVSPLEGLTLNQRITDRYYASFADLAA